MQTAIKTLTGSQVIIHTLKSLGLDSIFGYPGGIVLNIYDELSKQNDISHFLMRHEQAAIHAAEGYAKVSGKCGIVLVTSGPGATNLVTGLANAYLDGTPLIAITGQVSAELLHKNSFQEVDIISITKSCTKKNFQVTSAKELQSTLIDAYNIAMSGKKGPVLIDITKNVFSEQSEIIDFNEIETVKSELPININKTIEALNYSQKAVIIAGAGASYKEVQILSHRLNIPVVRTMMGFYPQNDENYIGMVGIFGQDSANNTVKESDLIFAIGARLNDRIKCCFGDMQQCIIQLNIDPSNIPENSISLIGDSKSVLKNIIEQDITPKNKQWLEYTKQLKSQNLEPQKRTNVMHSFEVMKEIQKYLKGQYTVTTEVGQHQVWAARYLNFNEPNKFITSGGLGTMGFGFPAAIGASIAQNNSPVVCIAGDGSLQMNIQELATCMDYKLPVKVLILDNGYLGMVRQFQEKSCEERYFATKISNPDFVKLAESYGTVGIRVEKLEDIKSALDKAFSTDKPVLVDFVVEPMEIL